MCLQNRDNNPCWCLGRQHTNLRPARPSTSPLPLRNRSENSLIIIFLPTDPTIRILSSNFGRTNGACPKPVRLLAKQIQRGKIAVVNIVKFGKKFPNRNQSDFKSCCSAIIAITILRRILRKTALAFIQRHSAVDRIKAAIARASNPHLVGIFQSVVGNVQQYRDLIICAEYVLLPTLLEHAAR